MKFKSGWLKIALITYRASPVTLNSLRSCSFRCQTWSNLDFDYRCATFFSLEDAVCISISLSIKLTGIKKDFSLLYVYRKKRSTWKADGVNQASLALCEGEVRMDKKKVRSIQMRSLSPVIIPFWSWRFSFLFTQVFFLSNSRTVLFIIYGDTDLSRGLIWNKQTYKHQSEWTEKSHSWWMGEILSTLALPESDMAKSDCDHCVSLNFVLCASVGFR